MNIADVVRTNVIEELASYVAKGTALLQSDGVIVDESIEQWLIAQREADTPLDRLVSKYAATIQQVSQYSANRRLMLVKEELFKKLRKQVRDRRAVITALLENPNAFVENVAQEAESASTVTGMIQVYKTRIDSIDSFMATDLLPDERYAAAFRDSAQALTFAVQHTRLPSSTSHISTLRHARMVAESNTLELYLETPAS